MLQRVKAVRIMILHPVYVNNINSLPVFENSLWTSGSGARSALRKFIVRTNHLSEDFALCDWALTSLATQSQRTLLEVRCAGLRPAGPSGPFGP